MIRLLILANCQSLGSSSGIIASRLYSCVFVGFWWKLEVNRLPLYFPAIRDTLIYFLQTLMSSSEGVGGRIYIDDVIVVLSC